jgi:cell wall integrity and stress response component
VFLTGTDNSVGHIDESHSDSDSDRATITAGPKSDATSSPDNANHSKLIITQDATTVVVTAPGNNLPLSTSRFEQKPEPSKGVNKAGIAAGVVIGVVALCALVGGLFFYLRNRKRRAMADEFHRNASNGHPVNGGHLSSSTMSDSRLEQSVMMQRRQSDGSIADNQDYSRRILKVGHLQHGAYGEN